MKEFKEDNLACFEDKNGFKVSFSDSASCCENFGWYYSANIPDKSETDLITDTPPEDLDSYVFDPDFYKDLENDYGGGTVVFEISNGLKTRYLCLFNHHNSYYSHSLTVYKNGVPIKDSYL